MKNPFRPTPAVVLFFLSPAIGELLSSSSPPAEFFNPLSLFFLTTLYGSGAILIRESILRWKKGWPSLLVLAAVYGIIEEGLMVKSFFDPGWMDIGILGSYGRALGVNWVWVVHLTIYHAVISILVPISITELLFPDLKGESWISYKSQKGLAALFVVNVVFSFFAITPYRPPLLPYVLAILVVIGLIVIARKLPVPGIELDETRSPKRIAWFLLGFFFTMVELLIPWIFPKTSIPAIFTNILLIFLALLAIWIIKIWTDGSMKMNERSRLALCSGVLMFFVLLSPLIEMDKTRPDNPAGMTLVGLTFLGLLLFLNRHYARYNPAKSI